jgi:predicted GTPase
LSQARTEKTRKAFERSDVAILVVETGKWGSYEEGIVRQAQENNIPLITVVNKIDLLPVTESFLVGIRKHIQRIILCSSINHSGRDECLNLLKEYLFEVCPDEFLNPPALIGDLVRPGL